MKILTPLITLVIAFFICVIPGYGQEDLRVSVSSSHIDANPGDEITYVIKYSNAGITPASNIVITDNLSSSGLYTYVSSSPSGTVSGNVITWDQTQLQELASLGNEELQITVTVRAGVPGNGTTQASNGYYISSSPGVLNNYATIKSNNTTVPLQSNIVSTTIMQNSDVHINNASGVIKSATNTVVYYMIQVINNGNIYDRYNLSSLNYDCDGAGGLGFEALPASFTDLNGNAITTTEWIAPDQTYYFLLKLTASPGTSPGNWSCHDVIATSTVGGIVGVGKIQTRIEGSPHYPLVSLSKIDAKDPVEAGEIFTYTIYAFNSNDAYSANNFVVKETYPPNVTFISSTPAPDPGYNNQWSLGNLNYGLAAAKTINISVKVNSLSNCNGNITNTVSASYDGYDVANPPSASVVTTIKSYPDLEITKTAESSTTPAKKGGSITYTLNYKNIGTCDAPNSQIKDLFDDIHTNLTNAGGGSQSGNEISWNLGLLTPGQSGSITYTVLIDPGSTFNPGTTNIINKASISTSAIESNYNNNTANASIPVSVLPDLKVEVLTSNLVFEAGTESTYTLKVSNVGDIAATNVEIKNLLPVGLTIGTISNGGTNSNGSISWPIIPSFGVGSSVEYQVKITPSCAFIPLVSLNATVTSSIIDKDDTNNSLAVNFTIQDNALPVLVNVPADLTVSCDAIPSVGTPGATDNCDGAPVVHYLGEASTRGENPLMPNYYHYTLTRTWDATDASGNHSITGVQVITVEDVTPPETPVLADVTVGECSGTPTAPTTTDNCKGVVTGTTTTVFPIIQQGTTVVTWTFDDGNGNVTTANQNVIVDDVTAPVADVASLPTITGECSATVTAPTATDNCKGSLTGTTTDPLIYSVQGTYTIHWNYDDGNGNIATQNQNVVIDDVTAPEAPVLADVTVGECSGTPVAPTTTDNCAGVITGTTTTIFPLTQQGTTVVTWTFDDGQGNVTTANQNVIVDDVTAPVADVALLPIITGECSATVTVPTSTDNCSGVITATTTDPLTYTAQGTYTIHWSYDDGNGNIATQNQTVVVDDVTAPEADVALLPTITGECSATVTAPTATDNCSGVITATTTDPLTYSSQGTYTIHWTYDDGNGNIVTQNQTVVVDDVTAPEAPVLADVTVGECSGTPVAPITNDNCAGTITGTTSTVFPITQQGTTVVTWTFDDGNGNVTTANQNVIVDDFTAPVADVASLPTITGECSATVTAPTATDNCKGSLTGTTSDPLTYTAQGTYTIHWTYDDGNGNISTQDQTIVLDDITAPVANLSVLPPINGQYSVTATAPTATDNCIGIITATTLDPMTYTAQGTYTIHWIYDDGNGNISSQEQTIIVDDTTPPLTPVLADIIVGECSGTPVAPTTTDDTSGVITGTTSTIFPLTQQGTTIVTWTFDDGQGNVTTANQNVIVDDVTAPVADVASLPTITGECSATVTAPTATDNCKGNLTGTTTDPLIYSVQGTYTIHWTYDDGNGNIATQNQTVVVDDVTAPEAPVLADVTVGECSGTPVAPTTTDNCAGTITGTTSTVFPITQQGITIVTWTFDDGNGNVTTANQNVIVDDVTAPEAPVLADVTVGECSGTPVAPTTNDNCAGTITGTTLTVFPITQQGTTVVTWTFDDGQGNVTTANQNVIVDDVTAPEADVASLPTITGECSATVTAPTATDNCKGSLTGTTTDPLTYTAQGTYTIHWTYDDGNGNFANQNQTVIIDDTTAPEAPVLADVTVGECSGTPVAPTTNDDCAGTITGTTSTIFPLTQQGITIVTWTFDDGNGNVTTANQNVIVDDITAPVPDVALLPTITGECSVTVTMPTATDNCSGVIAATTSDPLTYSSQGTYTIHWTYDDGNGNVSTQNQSVVVHDLTAPVPNVVLLPDVTGQCNATATVPTATDNCSGVITATTTDPLTYSSQGTYTIHWTYDDSNGNIATQNQTVVVDDVTAPEAPVLADVTVGECSGTPVAPITNDNCAGVITGTTLTVFPLTQQGTTVVTWTFDDGNGNVTTVNQNIIVDDVTAPVADEASLPTITGECSATVTAPSATDNCKGSLTGTTTDPLIYSVQGTYIIHWSYDDGNGNITTQNQTVIVDDTTAPVAPVLADVTVGECSGTPVAPITNDNCSGVITGTTTSVFPLTQQGTTIVTWTFDDGNGNVTTANQNVIVDDVTAPVPDVALLPIITGECSATVIAPTATDNCKGSITATTTDPLTYSFQGTYTIHWTYDDGNGNIATQNQNVVVDDVTAPVPNVVLLPDVTGQCNATATVPTATDNCSGVITATTTDPLTYSSQGTYIIHWTFDDGNGNIATQNQTVVIDDTTAPETPVLADVFLGECSGTPPIPTTTDNCKGIIEGTTSILFPKTKQGKHTILWTFDDGNGNITTAYQNIIVDDVTAPVPDVASLATITGECSATVTAPSATDNCKGSITATTSDPLTYTAQGTYTIHWTYDDSNGNIVTQNQTVVVDDVTAPEAPVLADVTVGECSGTPVTPITNDNCAGTITGTTSTIFPLTQQGITVVTWTFDDGNGNVTTANQNVIVDDITAPAADVALLPTIIGECSATATAPTSTDNCSGVITATTTDPLTYTAQGTYTIHWSYDDGNGNIATQNQSVVVDDVTAPISPVLADVTVGECSGTPVAPITNDNCGGVITGTTSTVFPITQQGTTVVTWTFDDGNGNVTTANQNVIVDDITEPVAPVLADVTVGECSGTPVIPTTTDNCSGIITGTTSTVFPITEQGTTVVTWTFDDGNGNVTKANQNILVDDITSPEISGTIASSVVEGCSAADVLPAVNTVAQLEAMGISVSDACTPDELLLVTSTDALNGLMPVVVKRTYTIKDANGNTSDFIHTITVADTQKPDITCPADINVKADAGKCTVTGLDLGMPVTHDNCSISSVSNDAPAVFGTGKTIVTWTVIDGNGNTSTCRQTVNVDGSPLAMDDQVETNEKTKVNGNVVSNDLGLCDTPLLVSVITNPKFGSLTFSNEGNFEYLPDDNYFGKDSFTYQVCDNDGDCSSAIMEITINSVNDRPISNNDTEDLQVDVILHGNVAANDVLSRDGNNAWSLITSPANGIILFNQDGTYTYTPNISFIGSDSFSYELCDANGDCSRAKVTINIADVLLPNQILTPNADDHNDTFIITGIEFYPVNKVTIYNRWGNVVYSRNNYQNEWDGYSDFGKVGSKPLPVGTYYYLIDYGNNRHKTGFVYLDR